MSGPVKVEVPEDPAAVLDPSGRELGAGVREALLLYLFEHDVGSSGKGAELLGMEPVEFWDLLCQRDIPYFRQTPEEVMEDLGVVETGRGAPSG